MPGRAALEWDAHPEPAYGRPSAAALVQPRQRRHLDGAAPGRPRRPGRWDLLRIYRVLGRQPRGDRCGRVARLLRPGLRQPQEHVHLHLRQRRPELGVGLPARRPVARRGVLKPGGDQCACLAFVCLPPSCSRGSHSHILRACWQGSHVGIAYEGSHSGRGVLQFEAVRVR